MFTAEDVITGAQFIRYYLDDLLREHAALVRGELDALLARAENGEKVDNLILRLLNRYPATKEWMHRYLVGDRRLLLEQTREAHPSPAYPAWDGRVVNAWVDGLSPQEALQVEQPYSLRFNVALPQDNTIAMQPFRTERVFQELGPEVESIEILIALETDDFSIQGARQRTLVVPRTGPSQGDATFTIVPLHQGPGTIVAQLFVRERKFQEVAIRLQGGTTPADAMGCLAQARGLDVQSAFTLPPRPDYGIDLDIAPLGSGYLLKLRHGGVSRAVLALTETKLAQLVAYARHQLRSIVYTELEGRYVYQSQDTHISSATHMASLRTLAKLGYYLYQELFYAPGNGPDAHALGARLRELSQQHRLTISVDADRFVFPWTLLYDRDPLDVEHVDPDGFWGFKHLIEYLPQFRLAPIPFSYQIVVADLLPLGFIVNMAIDTQLQRQQLPPAVTPHRIALARIPKVQVSEHPTCSDLYHILRASGNPSQILYFYCHAESKVPGDWADVAAAMRQDVSMRLADGAATLDIDSSKLILTDGTATLRDLKTQAPLHHPMLAQAPLVFMNACQGAEVSPYLYDGLVPYLVARGARGLIGAEVDAPIYFAAAFAQAFLHRFALGGQSLGEVLLGLRRDYLENKQNVLGLIYALYGSGDLVIVHRDTGA